jgi:UDP-N-acetylmuramoyl-tripeptide--D-alanyl-D-alanine ligase
VVERGRAVPSLPCFEVDDTLRALGALARAHLERRRRLRPLPVIAIGGAAGKTTTKELTAAVMRALCGPTLATFGNLNNRIGVPMTLFQLTGEHQAAVIECGTNQRGEIAALAEMVQPDAALVLNVDLEHTAGLGSLAGVADEEAALFCRAQCAVVSTEEPMLCERVPSGLRRLTFGESASADVRLVSRTLDGDGAQTIRLHLRDGLLADSAERELTVALRLLGASAASNAAAALAAGCAAVKRPLRREETAAIAAALGSVQAVPGRLQLRACAGAVVLDDTYNSNPRSLRAALATARELAEARRARLILVIGDMLELGELAAVAHLEAIEDLRAVQPATIILVGAEFCSAAAHSDLRRGDVATSPDSAAAASLVTASVRSGDVVLVKGSRGIAMERIVEALCARVAD